MNRLPRKHPQLLGDTLKEFFRLYRLSPQINRMKIFEAWNEASGAANYTSKLFFRDGILYVTVSSSVVRSQLSFQIPGVLEKMNSILSSDSLFDPECKDVGYVKELRIK